MQQSKSGPSRQTSLGSSPNAGLHLSPSRGQAVVHVGSAETALSLASGSVDVTFCGRLVSVSNRDACSILGLQTALQGSLGMAGQPLQFFDAEGKPLATDQGLVDAISGGQTPLKATLTDASIHYIENRRHELAEMQWKLMRDEQAGATDKIQKLSHQVSELKQELQTYREDQAKLLRRIQTDLERSLVNEREVAHSENKQLAERANAIAQLVSGEANKREANISGLEKSIDIVRHMFDTERQSHGQDLNTYTNAIQDAKGAVEDEKTARQAFEERHMFDIQRLAERIDAAQSHFSSLLQDQVTSFKKSAEECNSALVQQNKLVVRTRGDTDQQLTDTIARINDFDTRCLAMETRMAEAAARQAAMLEQVMQRHESVAQGLESVRYAVQLKEEEIPEVYAKIRSLEDFMNFNVDETREMFQKEKVGREEQMRKTQLHVLQEQTRQTSDLERKIAERLERESNTREEGVKELFQEVAKRTAKKVSDTQASTPGIPPARAISTGPTALTAGPTASVATMPQTTSSEYSYQGGSIQLPNGTTTMVCSTPSVPLRSSSPPAPSMVSVSSPHLTPASPSVQSTGYMSTVQTVAPAAVSVQSPTGVSRHSLPAGGSRASISARGSSPGGTSRAAMFSTIGQRSQVMSARQAPSRAGGTGRFRPG